MSDAFDRLEAEDAFDAIPEGGAEGGSGGATSKPFVEPERHPTGSPIDAAKSWASSAALGGGPQIAGAMGAIAHAATDPLGRDGSDADAYREVRNAAGTDIAKSDDTWWGKAGKTLGLVSTPMPVKALPKGAGALAHAKQGLKVGTVVGGVHGALNSDADFTKDGGWQKYAELLKDTAFGAGGGALGGAATGGAMGALEKPLRSTARRLPMDMLGVTEPARRSMQRQGIYDEAGDELLNLVRPGRSGMRKGSLTEDALNEANRRGVKVGQSVDAVDAVSGGSTVNPGSAAVSVMRGAKPFSTGSLQDKQVAKRMGAEAENLLASLGEAPISLAKAEEFKQRFGPAVGKQLRHAGEPAAKTDALAETYRALKTANEAGAANVSPELAQKFIAAKEAYRRIAAPLEGASVERSGMRSSDFDWGDVLSAPPQAPNMLTKAIESIPLVGPLVTGGLNLAGRAYGRGTAAKSAEWAANRMANNPGGGVGGALGDAALQTGADKLAPWSRFLKEEDHGDE